MPAVWGSDGSSKKNVMVVSNTTGINAYIMRIYIVRVLLNISGQFYPVGPFHGLQVGEGYGFFVQGEFIGK